MNCVCIGEASPRLNSGDRSRDRTQRDVSIIVSKSQQHVIVVVLSSSPSSPLGQTVVVAVVVSVVTVVVTFRTGTFRWDNPSGTAPGRPLSINRPIGNTDLERPVGTTRRRRRRRRRHRRHRHHRRYFSDWCLPLGQPLGYSTWPTISIRQPIVASRKTGPAPSETKT